MSIVLLSSAAKCSRHVYYKHLYPIQVEYWDHDIHTETRPQGGTFLD